jgi:hypothetical protein
MMGIPRMAERSQRTRLVPQLEDDERWRPSARAWQLALWGGAALAAVAMAVAAASTESGSRRLSQAGWSALELSAAGTTRRRLSFDSDIETRRMAEAIQMLAGDRDRLQARISALEHSVEDVTGGIRGSGQEPPPHADTAATSLPAMAYASGLIEARPSALGGAPQSSSRLPALASISGNAGPAMNRDGPVASDETGPLASVATKTEFGVDLGSASSMAGLRSLWQSLKETHEALFDGLRPVMAVREGARPGTIELRLVAGPLANAGAAARLCAALSATIGCQATIFDGQRLALK